MPSRTVASAVLLASLIGASGAAGAMINRGQGEALRQLAERRQAAHAARKVLAGWPAAPRAIAQSLSESLGAPDSVSDEVLVWRRRGDWAWVAVRRHPEPPGILQHAVRYEQGTGTLVAGSDSVGANILALNLAVDVLEGRLSPSNAPWIYAKTLELAASGKSSQAMRRLRFAPAQRLTPREPRPGELWRFP